MSNTPATDWYQDDHDFVACPRCGGEGAIEWDDAPDLWGDDMAEGLENHFVDCPDCDGKGGWEATSDSSASTHAQDGGSQ